jgi:hypothetical protein
MTIERMLAQAQANAKEHAKLREKWQAEDGRPLPFWFLNKGRECDLPWLTDEQMAGLVRMLMRHDYNHESVVCAARDRILHLSQSRRRIADALRAIVDCYGVGSTPEQFLKNVTTYVEEAKQLLETEVLR